MNRGLSFSRLSVGLAFVAIAALACLSPMQSDSFWALRAGQDIWRLGRVPLVDTYSHTAAGRFWPDHEWLWQALAYGLFRAGGLALLTLGVSALLTGAYALTYRLMAGPPLRRVGILLLGVTVAADLWVVRPQVASLLLLAVLLWLLVREHERFIPLLFALWANLHGGVVMGGLVMVAATGAALLFERQRFARLAVVTALAGAATALTPLGTGLWTFIAHWALAARQTGVSEWSPVYPTSREGVAFWALALGFVVLTARRWRHLTTWPDRLLVLIALVMLPFAARAVRNVSPFLLVAMPAATRLLAGWRTRPPPAALDPGPVDHPRFNLALAAGLGALAGVAVALCWARPLATLNWRPVSPAAAAAIASCPGPLYNGYNEGGALIWFVPQQPVFIDGRHDPYPPALLIEDGEVERGRAPALPFLARHGIRCAAVAPDAFVAAELRAKGWRPRFQDDQWLVLVPAEP